MLLGEKEEKAGSNHFSYMQVQFHTCMFQFPQLNREQLWIF